METIVTETVRKKSRMAEFFGQFAEGSFWLGLAEMAVREVFKAAALALAGTITFYVQKKFSNSIPQASANTGDPTLTQKAFGGDSYTSQYRNNSNSYYPTNTQAPTTFPGFGAR